MLLLALAPVARAQSNLEIERFHTELLDARGEAGRGSSVVLDALDFPHIASYGVLSCCEPVVKYAWQDAAGWHFEDVALDTGWAPGARTSIALDAAGAPHVAYHDALNKSLRYASRSAQGVWTVETADDSADVGLHCSLALDSADQPHIAYYDAVGLDLKYARKNGADWQVQTVDEVGDVGRHSSLALDAMDNPHIGYHDATNQDLRYVRKSGPSFLAPETVDSAGDVGFDASLKIDGTGTPHVSYISILPASATMKNIRYASRNGGLWTAETAASYQFVSFGRPSPSAGTCLAFAQDGTPYIAVAQNTRAQVLFKGVQWTYLVGNQNTDEFEPNTRGLRDPSLALTSEDEPRISYHSLQHRDLLYTSLTRGWQVEPAVQDAAASIESPSLALHQGAPSVSYSLSGGPKHRSGVYLVQRDAGVWSAPSQIWPDFEVSTLTAASSLQLNAQGLPRLSFDVADSCLPVGGCSTPQDLMFAWWTGAAWTVETIAAAGDVGKFHRLFLDANDTATVVYSDATNGTLRIARRIPIGQAGAEPWQTLPAALPVSFDTVFGFFFSGSAIGLPDGSVAVSHYVIPSRGTDGELHVAVWNGTQWSDEVADAGGGTDPFNDPADVGHHSSLAYDAEAERIAVAYTTSDSTLGKYAYRDKAGVWNVVPSVCMGGRPVLGLEGGSWNRPKFAVELLGSGVSVAASLDSGVCPETLDEGSALSMVVDGSEHVAYVSSPPQQASVAQLRYAVHTLPALSSRAPAQPPTDFTFDLLAILEMFCSSNGELSCPILDLDDLRHRKPVPAAAVRRVQRLVDLVALFCPHHAEMEKLGVQVPSLFQNTYLTLANVFPGADALVRGHGNEFMVDQATIDEAKEVLDQIQGNASPDLQAVVAQAYALTNDLQDFEGKSYQQSAADLGLDVAQLVASILEPLLVFLVVLGLTVWPRLRRLRSGV